MTSLQVVEGVWCASTVHLSYGDLGATEITRGGGKTSISGPAARCMYSGAVGSSLLAEECRLEIADSGLYSVCYLATSTVYPVGFICKVFPILAAPVVPSSAVSRHDACTVNVSTV